MHPKNLGKLSLAVESTISELKTVRHAIIDVQTTEATIASAGEDIDGVKLVAIVAKLEEKANKIMVEAASIDTVLKATEPILDASAEPIEPKA